MAKKSDKKSLTRETAPKLSTNNIAPKFTPPLRAAVDNAFNEDTVVRQAITANLKDRQVESKAITDRVDAAFEKFSPANISSAELAKRHFVAHGDKVPVDGKRPQTYRQRLDDVQNTVIAKGVEAMASSKVKRSITLRKTEALKNLIAKKPKNGGSAGTVGLHALAELITAMPITDASQIYTQCRAEVDAQRILDEAEGKPAEKKDDAPKNGDTKAKDRAADELVNDTVNIQMETATSPESPLLFNVQKRADQAALQSTINTFELRTGASDVTSYHDFSTLQIAFAHVWSQIFDGQLESLGKELYQEYVKLKQFTGSNDPDLEIGTLDDLSRLMAEIKKLSQTVQDDVPAGLLPAGNGQGNNDAAGLGIFTPADGVRAGVAAATGGASLFIEWAFNELIQLGNKPVTVTWDDFPLNFNKDDGNIIEMSTDPSGALPGTVEIVLQTDGNSYKKKLVFQQWDPNRQVSIYNSEIVNFPPPKPTASLLLNTSQIAYGTIKFISEDKLINELLLGRYVLGDLSQALKDRTRVTFHWKGGR